MLIAGLRHIDRVRGTGWLDCPNCHEHAAQDVIDDMTFVEVIGYRLSPVGRRRVLLCRRCSYRRAMTPEEMRRLETGGAPIHRAVMAPVGIIGLGIIGGVIGGVYAISQASSNAAANAEIIQYTPQSGQRVFPASFLGPSSWNFDPEGDQDPPYIKMSDSGGRMYFVIRRVTDCSTLPDCLKSHFTDEVGITTTGFPDQPPAPQTTKVADQETIWVRVKYNQGAENDEQDIYLLAHDGVGYVITYVALGDDAIKTMRTVAERVNTSLKFTATETPPPATPTPSPSASATP